MSKSDGSFVLRIPTANSTYLVTYCATSYDTFTKRANDNVKEGTAIDPEPIRLFPVGGGADAMRASLQNLRDDTRETTVALQESDGAAFTEAVQTLSTSDQALVKEWTASSATSTDAQRRPGETTRAALQRVTQSFRTTLNYFATASPQHFSTEAQRFTDIGGYVRREKIGPIPKDLSSVIPKNLEIEPRRGGGGRPFVTDPRVCENKDLLRALAYLYFGSSTGCDSSRVARVDSDLIDRPTLLSLLRNSRLYTNHLFYEERATKLEASVDWVKSKRGELDALKNSFDDGMVFMIATATSGDRASRMSAALDRVLGVEQYFKTALQVPCRAMRVATVVDDVMRLDEADAAILSIDRSEYRAPAIEEQVTMGSSGYKELLQRSSTTLNDAVHVLQVPCGVERLSMMQRELIWYHYRASVKAVGTERTRQWQVGSALFTAGTDENKTEILTQLCSYCSGPSSRPEGAPGDATREEACDLARKLAPKQGCDDFPFALRRGGSAGFDR